MKVNSTVSLANSVYGFLLISLLFLFSGSKASAQCNTDPTSGPVDITILLTGSTAVLNQAALVGVINPVDDAGLPCVGCSLWFQADGETEWEEFYNLSCDGSTPYQDGIYQVTASVADPDVDASCQSTAVELTVFLDDVTVPSIDVTDGETPDCDATVGPLNTSEQYDYTGDAAVVNGGTPNNCITTLSWRHPIFDDNCVMDELVIEFSSGSPAPDNLPSNITISGDANIIGAGGSITSSSFWSSSTDGSAVTIVNYMLTDSAGNVTNCSFEVQVVDDESPTINSCNDFSLNTGDGNDGILQDCGYTVSNTNLDPTATDNCSATLTHDYPIPDNTTLNGATFPTGVTLVEWTAEDANGNTETCTQEITVVDDENPLISCPGDVTVNNDSGNCSATNISDISMTYLGSDNPASLPLSAGEWYDNCSNAEITYTLSGDTDLSGPTVTDGNLDAGTETFNVGVTTVEYTITDDEGNITSCSFTVTVEDVEAPNIADCGSVLDSVGTDLFACSALYQWQAPSDLQDNCGLASFTCEVTDQEGNVVPTFNTVPSGCTNQVGFAGQWAPAFWTLNGNGSVNAGGAPASITLSDAPGGGTTELCIDVVNDGIIEFDYDENTPFFEFVFGAGYRVNANSTATPGDAGSIFIALLSGDEFCFTVTSDGIPGDKSTTISNFRFTCDINQKNAILPKGTNLITYTLTDIYGNDTTCVDTVVVYDDEAPTMDDCDDKEMNTVCPDVTVPDYTTNNNLSDNCPMVVVTQSPDPSVTLGDLESMDSIYFNGVTDTLQDGAYFFVTLVATDMGGNTDTCRFQVTLNDQNAPIPDVDPLPDINPMTTLGTDCGSYTLCAPTATDCNGTIIYGSATIAGATFDPNGCGAGQPAYTFNSAGVWSITWIYDDGNGNVATQLQSVEIIDDVIEPTLNCPANVTVDTDPGVCTATGIMNINMTEIPPMVAPYLDASDAPADGEGIDNCGIVEWSYQLSGATSTGVIVGNDAGTATQTFNLGVTTVTYFAEDAEGNVGSDSFEVTVEDNENPTATCPVMAASLSTGDDGDTAGDCVFTFNNTNYDPKNVDDNCSIADTIYTASSATPGVVISPTSGTSLEGMTVDLSGTATSSATVSVNWTITDGSVNTVNCSTVFTITDGENPTITCADDGTRQISMDATPDDCFYTVQGAEFDPVVTIDNCSILSVENDLNFGSTLVGENLPIGINVIEWTITDLAGNSTTCAVEITVEDDVPPVFNYCPDDVTLDNTTGDCSALRVWVQPNLNDLTDCDDILSIRRESSDPSVQQALDLNYPYNDTIGGVAIAEFPVGETYVRYIAEDSSGNMATCVMKVTVVDTEAPVFAVCPNDQVLGSICADALVPDYRGLSTVTDNCGFDTLIQDPAPGTLLSSILGPNPSAGDDFNVTLTATDADSAFLSTDCTFEVTLEDNEDPIPDVAGGTLPKKYNSCSSVIVDAPTASDCGETIYGVPVPQGTPVGNSLPITQYIYSTGVYVVQWTYTDNDGKTSQQNQLIEVEDDTTAPELTCPNDVTMYGTDHPNCNARNIPGIALSEGSLGIFTPGTYADTCTMDPDFTIEYALSGSTNVSRKLGSNAGIEVFNTGTTTVTYWVTDEAGNESSCSFDVMVMDDDAPDLAVPNDVTVQCDNVPPVTPRFATDNCDGTILALFNQDSIPGVCANEYTLIRRWTATDAKLNSTTGTQVITVIDTQAPNFNLNTGALDVVTTNDLNVCEAAVVLIMDPADVTDNCDGNVSITNDRTYGGNDASGVYPVGTTTVTFTATDNCGNFSTYEVDVTVVDNEDPIIACIQGLAFNIPDTDTLVLRPSDLYFFVRDNCAIDTVTMSQDTFTCEDVTGDFTDVILTATDIHGNIGTCTATVLIQDNIPPVAKCQDITAYLEADGQVTIDASDLDDGSSDNCQNQLSYYINGIGQKNETFDCNQKGQNLRTLIVEDPSGNLDQCTAIVTIVDTIDPVALCRDITVSLDANGMYSLDSNEVDNGSMDNCMITEISTQPDKFDCTDIGQINIIEMVVTDMSGNTDTCTAQVTVIDDLAPNAVCMDTTVYLDDNGQVTIDESYIDGGSTDNCDNDLSFNFTDRFTCLDTGLNIITVTVTDDYNNSSTCTAEVTVLDTTPPVAACIDVTLNLDTNGIANLNVNQVWDAANSSDNCSIEHARLDRMVFDCSDKNRLNPVVLTLEDASGNEGTCTANVTVLDITGPQLECKDITVYVDENTDVTISAGSVIDSVYDPCGLQDTMVSQTLFDCSDAGDNTVTVTAMDFTGNTSVCTAVVTVEYISAPTAVCQDITVTLGEDGTAGEATINANELDNGSEDACGLSNMLTFSASQTFFDCDDIGDNTVTLTVTDRFNNTSTCTANVHVDASELDVMLDDVVGDQGDIVTIPITVSDFIQITSLQFTVEINDGTVGRIVDTRVNNLSGATFIQIDDEVASFQFAAQGGSFETRANGSTIAFLDIELEGTSGEMSPVVFTDSQNARQWSSDCHDVNGPIAGFNQTDGSITVDMSPAMFTMGGTVRYYSSNDSIENVSIEISGHGSPTDTVVTDVNGEYSFIALNGTNPVIRPLNINMSYANSRDFYLAKIGANQTVTAFDQFVIAQDIFGVSPITDPYTLIAADVAATTQGPACTGVEINVGDISAIDEVLQGADSWAHDAWVFIPRTFAFNNANCPWEGGFDQMISLNNVGSAQTDLDFIGIKVGDVNGDFDLNTNLQGEDENKSRSESKLDLQYLINNNKVDFNVTNDIEVGSMQFGIKYDKNSVSIASIDFNEALMDQFKVIHKAELNEIVVIGFGTQTISLEGEKLFTISLNENVVNDGLSLFKISNSFLVNEVYSSNYGLSEVILSEQVSTDVTDGQFGQFELLQNRPNPFNENTTISWILPYATPVDVMIMNDLGQVIYQNSVEGKSGLNTFKLDRSVLPTPGILFYQIKTAEFSGTKSMLLTN